MKILVLNGPNLNLLGAREPQIYGTQSYADLVEYIQVSAQALGCEVEVFQTNHEGVLIDKIQQAQGEFDGLILNAGGYTHTSIAILDALRAVRYPAVEVHLTDISAREPFRRLSYPALACRRSFLGHGFAGYRMALEYLCADAANSF